MAVGSSEDAGASEDYSAWVSGAALSAESAESDSESDEHATSAVAAVAARKPAVSLRKIN